MNPRQKPSVSFFQQATLVPSAPCLGPEKTEAGWFLDDALNQGDCLHLRPQQRVPLPPPEKVVILREGMLAIDAVPTKGKLQVLDFLLPGDIVSPSAILPGPKVSLRAITNVCLAFLDPPAVDQPVSSHEYWKFLMSQCMHQLARVNIHQLMIGRIETESRVASFVLSHALRNVRKDTPVITISLPMSRTDIANYLVINCDTLSRMMTKLYDLGLIRRISRHAISIVDLDELKKRSPLAPLLPAAFGIDCFQQLSSFAHRPERSVSMALVAENPRRS